MKHSLETGLCFLFLIPSAKTLYCVANRHQNMNKTLTDNVLSAQIIFCEYNLNEI